MGGRSAIAAVIAAWVGMLVGDAAPAITLAALLGASLMTALACRAPDRTGTVAIVIALGLAASARGGAHRMALDRDRTLVPGPDGMVRLIGVVAEPPQRESGTPLVVMAVRASEPPMVRGTRVQLRLPAGAAVEWSDEVVTLARLEAPPGRRNPGGYDARAALAAFDVVATGRAFWVRVSPSPGLASWPRGTVARWRRAIDRRFSRFDPDARELVVPLVVGDRSALSPELNARMRASGLIHLLALSGMHVAWMAGVARALVAALGLPLGARGVAGAACALFYLGVAGPIPSLVRAVITELVTSAARGRAVDALQSLAVTALVLLAAAPGWAADLGFQLSCAATLGLITVGQAIVPAMRRFGFVGETLAATAGAQAVAMPLLLARFHAWSWVAPFANLLAVPVSGLLLVAAWLTVVSDGLIPGSGRWWASACDLLAAWLRAITERAADLPCSLLGTGADPLPVALTGFGAIAIALAVSGARDLDSRRRPVSSRRFVTLGAGLLALALALFAVSTPRPLVPGHGRCWLVALDVGQGDAIALAFEDGWWLIDAGPRSPRHDAGESVILPFLRWAGVRDLRTLVLTHADGDHTGGAPAVLRGVSVDRVLWPPAWPGVPGPGRRFAGLGAARGARLRDDPEVRVLWPPAPGAALEPGLPAIASDNSASLVLEVRFDSTRALLLADVDSLVESALEIPPGVALLKVAHHGSSSSSGGAFLTRLHPREAILSCGRHNPFGHPAPATLDRLRAAGARLHRTDLEGAVWFELSARGVRRLDWRRATPEAARAVARSPLESAPAP